MGKALEGIRVIDFTHNQAGPSCAQMLAWLGADVIKVEGPEFADSSRTQASESPDLDSPFYLLLNSNKRSITLNLKTEKGKEICKKLICQADVAIENFSLGVMDRLGLGYEVLRTINPRLIYASIKGFGEYGPNSPYKCFEPIAQATSGAMSLTGWPENPPTVSAVCVGDSGTGMHCTIAILAALHQRERTGKGQKVAASMQESVLNLLRVKFTEQYVDGTPPLRGGNQVGTNVPSGIFTCKGGGPNDYVYLIIHRTSPSMWTGLLRAIGREDMLDDEALADPKVRVERRAEVDAMITQWTLQHDKHEVMRLMSDQGVPCGACYDTAEVLHDPHLRQREMVTMVDQHQRGPMPMLGCPIKLEDSPVEVKPAPRLGQHSEEVLCELLGYASHEVECLRAEGVI